VFMVVNQLTSTVIMAIGRFRLIMFVALVNLVSYLVLAVKLIPTHGAVGAAIATATMEGVNTIMQVTALFYLLRSRPETRA
jgi:O-antigen/teichoic acid export membrane protein